MDEGDGRGGLRGSTPAEPIVRLRDAVLGTAKYRDLDAAFVERIVAESLGSHRGEAAALKAAKAKLHQAVGAFSGANPQRAARRSLAMAGAEEGERLRAIMRTHASTAERERFLDEFSAALREWCGPLGSVSDYACGLGAAAIPWLNLDPAGAYWCCEVDVRLLEIGSEVGSGLVRRFTAVPVDLAAPELDTSVFVESDLALALKVYTTLERQRSGAGVRLLRSIPGSQVVVSLPARSLGGRRSYVDPEGELERLAELAGFEIRANRAIGPELYAHLVR